MVKTTGALLALAVAVVLGAQCGGAHAEAIEIRITRQPGALYMPMILMEQHKLIEKKAAAVGLGEVKPQWPTINSGGAAVDALLSGSVDVVTSGISNMLVLWDKTKGGVKAITGVAGLPSKLVTRNPNVKTIKDFGPTDRIAVPTIKVSMQAIMLGIALQKAWGDLKANEKLLTNQVQMGHPDAMAALFNPGHEVNSHFGLSPFQDLELKNPAIHEVLNSIDALGGPAHVACAFTSSKFYEANPKLVGVFFAAFEEALEMIRSDPKAASESYLSVTKEKMSPDELVQIITQPGAIFQAAPVRTMIYADYMHQVGFIKTKPASWKDYFHPLLHAREGS